MSRLAIIWTERVSHKLIKWHIRAISRDGAFYGDVKGQFNHRTEHRNVDGKLDSIAIEAINECVEQIQMAESVGAVDSELCRGRMVRRADGAEQVLYSYPLEREDESDSGKAFLRIIDLLRPVVNNAIQ